MEDESGEDPYGEGKMYLVIVSPGDFVALHTQGRTVVEPQDSFPDRPGPPILSPEDIQGFCRIQLLESPTSSCPGERERFTLKSLNRALGISGVPHHGHFLPSRSRCSLNIFPTTLCAKRKKLKMLRRGR